MHWRNNVESTNSGINKKTPRCLGTSGSKVRVAKGKMLLHILKLYVVRHIRTPNLPLSMVVLALYFQPFLLNITLTCSRVLRAFMQGTNTEAPTPILSQRTIIRTPSGAISSSFRIFFYINRRTIYAEHMS